MIFRPIKKVNLINQKNAGDLKNVVSERFRMLADQQKKFEPIPKSDFGDMASQSFAFF